MTRVVRFPIVVLGLLTLLATAGCDPVGAPPPPAIAPSTSTLPATGGPAHTVVGRPPAGAGPFTLDVTSGASTVRVVPGSSGTSSLYQVATPPGTTVFPTVRLSGRTVDVGMTGGGDADLTVALNPGVPWDLNFAAGVGVIDVTVPRPSGARTITETSGASTLNVHLPKATPVTVHALAGAGLVALYGRSHSGVAAGTTFRYGRGADRYTIKAIGGVSSLTVRT
jgi:hypothetical protein